MDAGMVWSLTVISPSGSMRGGPRHNVGATASRAVGHRAALRRVEVAQGLVQRVRVERTRHLGPARLGLARGCERPLAARWDPTPARDERRPRPDGTITDRRRSCPRSNASARPGTGRGARRTSTVGCTTSRGPSPADDPRAPDPPPARHPASASAAAPP